MMLGRAFNVFLLLTGSASAASPLLSHSGARLPMGMSTVINDMEAEGVETIQPVAILKSRSVTKEQSKAWLSSLFGSLPGDEGAFGKENGLLVVYPGSVSTVTACRGTIAFLADSEDLVRGEGLMELLAPALEEASVTNLVVVVKGNVDKAKTQIERAASLVGIQLPSEVHYLSEISDVEDFLCSLEGSCDPADAATAVSAAVAARTTPLKISSMSAKEISAARALAPVYAACMDSAFDAVRKVAANNLVPRFGELCSAAVNRALADFDEQAKRFDGIPIANKMRSDLEEQLYGQLRSVYDEQVSELGIACFEGYKRNMSKLKISPTLSDDMDKVVKDSIKEFKGAVGKLQPKGGEVSSWPSTGVALGAFKKRVREFASNRMLAARASGQLREFPRKGVTLGLHWLLPKPFGNDYRQEPWEAHTKDNLVFVPKDKLADVSPEALEKGDWRDSVVPNPAGNEMIYLQ